MEATRTIFRKEERPGDKNLNCECDTSGYCRSSYFFLWLAFLEPYILENRKTNRHGPTFWIAILIVQNRSVLHGQFHLSRYFLASNLCKGCHYHANIRLLLISQQNRIWLIFQSFFLAERCSIWRIIRHQHKSLTRETNNRPINNNHFNVTF